MCWNKVGTEGQKGDRHKQDVDKIVKIFPTYQQKYRQFIFS